MTTATAAPAALPPGAVFGVPGYTQQLEQFDAITGFNTVLAQSAQTPWNPPGSFQKTDVIFWWEMVVDSWVNNLVVGTATANISPYAPYNLFQNLSVKMQGKYLPLEVVSGIDAAIFQMYRPMRGNSAISDLMGANPFGVYAIPNNQVAGPQYPFAQTNQTTTGITPTTTPISFILELPGCIWLDEYWDIAQNGRLMPNASGVVAPMGAFISPQYMGGGERVVLPKFNLASGVAANYDQGPIALSTTGTITSYSGSVNIDTRRVGVYGSQNVAELPPVFNWQYRRHSYEYPINNQPKVDIPIQDYGQILSVFVRIFDPALGTNGTGAPYNITGTTGAAAPNVTKCQLFYGSNLVKFDDTPFTMQKRFLDQHGFLPPNGVIIWDMAIKKNNTPILSNAGALNTLTNANCKVHLEFITTNLPSASAYAVVGLEYLPYVSQS